MGFRADINAFASAMQKQGGNIDKAASDALNKVAQRAVEALADEVESVFDRPSKFTLRAFATKPSTRYTQESTVFIRDLQSKYLKLQIDGGRRKKGDYATSPRAGIITPGKDGRRSALGGVPRGAVKRQMANKSRYWVGKYKNREGVWERFGRGGRKLRIAEGFQQRATYKKAFRFHDVVKRVALKHLKDDFNVAWTRLSLR